MFFFSHNGEITGGADVGRVRAEQTLGLAKGTNTVRACVLVFV